MKDNCSCVETFLHEEGSEPIKLIVPDQHDCEYIRKRNSHIPKVSALAHGIVRSSGIEETDPRYGARWTRAFSEQMDRLSKNGGQI